MRSGPPYSTKLRLIYLGTAFTLYVLLELALLPVLGVRVSSLAVFPTIVLAWYFGPWFGVTSVGIFLVWDFGIFLPAHGFDGAARFVQAGWIGAVVQTIVTAVAGRLGVLQTRLQVELAERQLAETELRATRDDLERRVEQRTAELAERERDLYQLMDQAPDGILIFDESGCVLSANQRIHELSGYSLEGIREGGLQALIDEKALLKVLRTGPVRHGMLTEQRLRRQDGSELPVEISVQKVRDGKFQAIVRDITERLRTEQALRDSEARLSLAMDAAGVGMWDSNLVTGKVVWSQGMHRMFDPLLAAAGVSRDEFFKVVHKSDRETLQNSVGRAMEVSDGQPADGYEVEYRVTAPGHPTRWMLGRGKAIRDETGRAIRLIGINIDITERKESEERLRTSERRFQIVSRATKDVIYDWNISDDRIWWSDNIQSSFGYTMDQLGHTLAWWEGCLHPEDRAYICENLASVLEEGEFWEQEYRFRCATGHYAFIHERGYIVRDEDGTAVRMIGSLMDITARRQAEGALRNREEFYRAVLEHSTDNVTVLSPDGVTLYESPATERVSGHTPEELLGKNNFSLVHPDDTERVLRVFETALALRIQSPEVRYRFRHKDGGWRTLESVGRSFVDENGQLLAIVNTRDVTEREQLEQQLRQSQKMEAVGSLAGGIAHDFNNILTVIINYSQLASDQLAPDSPVRQDLEEIARASERAANLTRQLLAFSRKQVLTPKVTSFTSIVAGLRNMLARLIGEDIEFRTSLAPNLWNVEADIGQIEQVIVNLVVNARDAMPTGGLVTIETRNETLTAGNVEGNDLPAGDYAVLSVSDTGAGMDHQTQQRVFEPFFTTKVAGKGTGLGLSTVYGIVQQSGGHITLTSALGRGSTFTVYLPRTAVQEPEQELPTQKEKPAMGTETILLVEDEANLRNLTRQVLVRNGYTVLEAENALAASQISAQHPDRIHLLLTDVVMPGRSGGQLAQELQSSRPDIQVLYMSGYTTDAVVRHGIEHENVRLLQKPFKPAFLLQMVAEVLREQRAGSDEVACGTASPTSRHSTGKSNITLQDTTLRA